MQLLAVAAVLMALQGGLDQYDLTIDQVYLDQLYADPWSGMSFPATFSCGQGETSCLAGFRGATSVGYPKKSWSIELDDHLLLGCSRLILDAHFRDSTLTRNCLALMITDLLGYPVSETRHVRFTINGNYYGVYLDTERIDADFLLRSGFEEGSLFKAIAHQSRFCWLPSGYWYDTGFVPRLDSDPFLTPVRSLIDKVNTGDPLPPMDTEMFLAYYAVTLAIMDIDAPTKNFYLYIPSDSVWRIFPWDRDATFGNDWLGRHHPELVNWVTYSHLMKTAMFTRLLEDPVNRAFFTSCLDSVAALMTEVLPERLDSIYNEIRSDVLADPLVQLTPEQFDDAFDDLIQFVVDRPQYIQGLGSSYTPPVIEVMSVSPAHMDPTTDSVRVSFSSDIPLTDAVLEYSIDGAETEESAMSAVPGSGNRSWLGAVSAGEIDHSALFTLRMYPSSSGPYDIPFCSPRYGFFSYPAKLSAHPGSIRPRGVFSPEHLAVHPPLRYGPDLWALPLTNTHASQQQDLSHCVIAAGKPAGWVFLPESILVPPGDTLFLTNNVRAMGEEFPGRTCVGDCAASSPAGMDLILMDPSWTVRMQTTVPYEDSISLETAELILSEICYDSPPGLDSGDWIELYNLDGDQVDIGGFILVDGGGNISLIPWGTTIGPALPFVVVREPGRFLQVNPEVDIGTTMSFRLAAEGDAVILLDRTGTPVFSVSYINYPPWPDASGKVLSLLFPSLPLSTPESWEAVDAPGSPGSMNPSWSSYSDQPLSILTLWPNPASSAIHFQYTSYGALVTGSIFDLSGRIVQRLYDLPHLSAEILVHLDERLCSGVYFLVLQSSGECSVRRFVCLR